MHGLDTSNVSSRVESSQVEFELKGREWRRKRERLGKEGREARQIGGKWKRSGGKVLFCTGSGVCLFICSFVSDGVWHCVGYCDYI